MMENPLKSEGQPNYLEYLHEQIDQNPKVEKCYMCGGEFDSIFYYDMRLNDWFWQGYCSKECEEIQGKIDLYEEEQLKKADLKMWQWSYWGQTF